MKLLFIHEVSYRKKVIFEMHEFPELLALRGHDVNFLEFDEGRKLWDKYRNPRGQVIPGRVHRQARVRLHRPFQLGIPGIDRILAVVTVIPFLSKILKKESFDAIVLYAVPTFGLQTIWLARKHKVPVMFRALDVSHKIRSSLLSPFIKAFERRVYRKADLLSANNPAMASYCNELGRRNLETKIHFPPLDLSHFQGAVRHKTLRAELGFSDSDRVIVYMGSFFYFSGLAEAMSEFGRLASQDSRLKFLLIGGGEQNSNLRKLASELGISGQVVFTGFVSYEDLPRYLKVADVAVNTLQPTLVANAAFPNKVLQYMAAGLPVVSTKLKGLTKTFGEYSGISWAADSKEVVGNAIKLAKHSDENLLEISQIQFAAVSKIFDVESAVAEFEKSLIELSRGFKR